MTLSTFRFHELVAVYVLAFGLCLFPAVEALGQTQESGRPRSVDPAPSMSMPVEPDSPGTSTDVATDQQTILPRLTRISGALHDATGKPVTGTVDVTFALYNSAAGGEPLWFETQTVQADDVGRYTALLGAMHTDGLPVDLFTSGEVRWLGLQVGLEAEQQPRILLVSVPYALKAGDAETLGGKPASAFVLADGQNGTATGTTTTSTSGAAPAGTKDMTDKSGKTNVSPLVAVCSTITSNAGGTVNSIPMFTATCNIENSVITQSGSNIGIGTPSPVDTLSVQGPSNTGVSVYGGGNQQGGFRWNPFSGGYLFLEDPSVSNPVALVGSGLSYMKGGHLSLGSSTDVSELQVTGASGASAGAAGNGIEELTTGTGLSTDNRLQFGIVDGSYGWIQSLKPGTGYHNLVLEPGGGNVGIGTTAPAATLDVAGDVKSSGHFIGDGSQLTNVTATGTTATALSCTGCVGNTQLGINYATSSSQGGAATNALALGGVGPSGYAPASGSTTYVAKAGDTMAGTLNLPANGLVAGTNQLVLFGGNVGIGTASPGAKLEVNGTVKFDQAVTLTAPATSGSPAAALSVQATDFSTANYGLYATSAGAGGTGVYGEAENGSLAVGVWGVSSSGLAGLFSGNLSVSGTITAGTKDFKIDDPIDPANKFLYHASVESSQMKTIYDGTVTLDSNGEAVVQMPAWFESLNGEFRYQLTCVGGYAPIYIAQKIQGNAFKIAGGTSGIEVDWQVTGVRHDAYAQAHPLNVEVEKAAKEQGYYLHPELFGQSPQKSLEWADHPQQMGKLKGGDPE